MNNAEHSDLKLKLFVLLMILRNKRKIW